MAELILTLIDTTGIQDFIFGSNRLRENIGASELVEQATKEWAKACIMEFQAHNLTNERAIDRTRCIENEKLDAELIYAGGGNTAILFADLARAPAICQHIYANANRARAELARGYCPSTGSLVYR